MASTPYGVLITWGYDYEETSALLNLINNERDIDKIYLYAKDMYKAKYELVINKRENAGWKYFNDSKAFVEYSNDMYDIYKNIEEYNQNKKGKILIIFDDMIAHILSNKKLNRTNSYVFITQSYFTVPKNVRLNSTHYFVLKIPNERKLQQIAFI